MQEPNIIPMEFGLLIMLSHSFSKTHTLYLVEWRVLQLLFQWWCNVDSGCFWPSLPLFYFSLGNWTRKYQKILKNIKKSGTLTKYTHVSSTCCPHYSLPLFYFSSANSSLCPCQNKMWRLMMSTLALLQWLHHKGEFWQYFVQSTKTAQKCVLPISFPVDLVLP